MSLEDLSLDARDELALLARQLAENPATRKDFLKLTKRAKPDMVIPELDIEEHTTSRLVASDKRVEALEGQLRDRDIREELDKRRSRIVEKGLASKDDMDDIERVMLDKGITNHEVAAEYWAFMKQAAQPTPTGYNPSPFKALNLSDYVKNPVTAARNEAAKALHELRKSPRPIGL
jgi:hypothetical protein